jgi:hypothetical protein
MSQRAEMHASDRLSLLKGEGEGEGLACAAAESNPSPLSSPLHQGERRKKEQLSHVRK